MFTLVLIYSTDGAALLVRMEMSNRKVVDIYLCNMLVAQMTKITKWGM